MPQSVPQQSRAGIAPGIITHEWAVACSIQKGNVVWRLVLALSLSLVVVPGILMKGSARQRRA
jgi:hypothetical protein